MASFSVITDNCTKDFLCVDVCQKKAIHPIPEKVGVENTDQLYIDPTRCTSCGSCISACESEAIFSVEDLPEDMQKFIEINAAYFKN